MRFFVIFIFSLVLALANCLGGGPIDTRIYGGVEVKIEDHPYQVSLHHRHHHICGGVIISEKLILTAAHCIHDIPISGLFIRAGSSYYYREGEGSVHKIHGIVEHEEYDPLKLDYDIAVLMLRTPLTLGPNIQVIPLATAVPAADTSVTVTGWGETLPWTGGPLAWKLRGVQLKIKDPAYCEELYYGYGFITDRMICASAPGKGSCLSDCGGPLVDNSTDPAVLVGIVSWGMGCHWPNYPGVYTSVPGLLAWIQAWLS